MVSRLNRRETLALIAAAGTVPACPVAARAAEGLGVGENEAFRHGVASGDPGPSSVVLWTRVESAAEREPVRWEVARDQGFDEIVRAGEAEALAAADHTVKVVPEGLEPGATYFYRFLAGTGPSSPVGRTRTLPAGPLDRLGIALASCSNHAFGHFNAYDAIARDAAVDVVLHTGDYIYEYGADGWGGEVAKAIGRVHEPAHEIVTLDAYRRRHAQYKRDPGSRAMHGSHPLIACWDDHEITNNPWVGGAGNHQLETEGDWVGRRTNGIRAYHEWMHVREPAPGRAREEFWRTYVFGGLATLVTLESRHTARGEQVSYDEHFASIRTREDRDRFMREVMGEPGRRMISEPLEEELLRALRASVAAGQPWRLVGNASPMARMLVPDVAALGIDPARRSGHDPGKREPDFLWAGRWNLPFYTDTWDGYPAAREAFYAFAARPARRTCWCSPGTATAFG